MTASNDPVQVEETVWDNRVRCEHRSLINIAIFLCIIITIPMILSVTIQYVNDAITSQTMFPSYEKDCHRSPSSSLSPGSLRSATTRTSQTMCQPKRRTAKLASRRTATSHTNQRWDDYNLGLLHSITDFSEVHWHRRGLQWGTGEGECSQF